MYLSKGSKQIDEVKRALLDECCILVTFSLPLLTDETECDIVVSAGATFLTSAVFCSSLLLVVPVFNWKLVG